MKLHEEEAYAQYCEEPGCRNHARHDIDGHALCGHHYRVYLEEEGMLIG